jgi:hypothetical protein
VHERVQLTKRLLELCRAGSDSNRENKSVLQIIDELLEINADERNKVSLVWGCNICTFMWCNMLQDSGPMKTDIPGHV